MMRRREFIRLLGSAVSAWPVAAHGQPSGRMRRVGVRLELLKELVPGMTRAAVLREPGGAGIGQWAVLQAAAAAPAVELSPINAAEPAEIDRAMATFARESNSGLIARRNSTVHELGHGILKS